MKRDFLKEVDWVTHEVLEEVYAKWDDAHVRKDHGRHDLTSEKRDLLLSVYRPFLEEYKRAENSLAVARNWGLNILTKWILDEETCDSKSQFSLSSTRQSPDLEDRSISLLLKKRAATSIIGFDFTEENDRDLFGFISNTDFGSLPHRDSALTIKVPAKPKAVAIIDFSTDLETLTKDFLYWKELLSPSKVDSLNRLANQGRRKGGQISNYFLDYLIGAQLNKEANFYKTLNENFGYTHAGTPGVNARIESILKFVEGNLYPIKNRPFSNKARKSIETFSK